MKMNSSEKSAFKRSKGELNRAGEALRSTDRGSFEFESAFEVLNAWRTAHAFPLNTIQVNLRGKVKRFGRNAFVAQRLKRTPTILDKLQRFPTMNLSRMQDIGGCRAVLPTVMDVRELVSEVKRSRMRHALVKEQDYIAQPKDSGYRGVHLIYEYRSDRSKAFNGLHIEVQVRTQLQHTWATAVETVGTFTQQPLKSSRGSGEWLNFFVNVSSFFAGLEDCSGVNGMKRDNEFKRRIRDAANHLNVRSTLSAFGAALNTIDSGGQTRAGYYLLELWPKAQKLEIKFFRQKELSVATAAYLHAERRVLASEGQVVLVKADSLQALKRAYPNYYLDSRSFLEKLAHLGV